MTPIAAARQARDVRLSMSTVFEDDDLKCRSMTRLANTLSRGQGAPLAPEAIGFLSGQARRDAVMDTPGAARV